MAAAFRPVNSPLAMTVSREDVMASSSATPRPNTAPQSHPRPADDGPTPTRATFNLASQKPLPSSPFPQGVQVPDQPPKPKMPRRHDSRHSNKSGDSGDVDMDDSDGETGTIEDGAGSDEESVGADGPRSSKKKKSQRFYCTDYPPCNLSFTRSEHLARHIRKHTGERPFQCHCSRRFSRLDNLRQHAQTVHVNENIPMDSLAATGSRFQRQMRPDRVRQAGNRARASTGGSAGGPQRGHSKSLSTSSITSVSSVGSAYSVHGDARRRPPPLVMADPRSRLSLESYRSAVEGNYPHYRPASPSDFGTPTSSTFSTGQSSPRWAPGVVSPATSHSRSHSMYTTGTRTPGRRLSVPSGANPFQSPSGSLGGRPMMFGPGPTNASNVGALPPTSNGMVTSPSPSTSQWPRRESMSESDWRRRTWHPDSRNLNGNPSQLSSVVNQSSVRPNPPPPIANPSNSQSSFRLPGIESFDPLPPRPATPPRRQPSPMMVDSEPHMRAAYQPHLPETPMQDERRNLNMYDASLQRGLNRLDINHSTPPRDSAGTWASEANKAVQAQAEHVRLNPPTVRFEERPPPPYHGPKPTSAPRSLHHHTMSAPSITTSRENKRRGWYHGPVSVHRDGRPTQEQPDPRLAHVDRMVHPNFTGFSGFPVKEAPPLHHQYQHSQQQLPPPQIQQQPQQQQQVQQQQQQGRPGSNGSMGRLEALVAVATSEGSTAAAY
ncbi:Up in starvation [Fusarium torreyae]|uniref:Up in starvation n=1 Tax=Fusarium torreyae TaxID=1237075 RepID=A0A9W8RPE5_9HYPO|nr:Up in starvation [Fusarium torreyae]